MVKWGTSMEFIESLYSQVIKKLTENKMTVTCMESMTGGFIASCITDIPGASAVFKGSYVCYSNEEKERLGVAREIISAFSVYSEETAVAMALAAKKDFGSDVAIGITGNAGSSDPANPSGIPGRVFIAVVTGKVKRVETFYVDPSLSRGKMKREVALKAAQEVLAAIEL